MTTRRFCDSSRLQFELNADITHRREVTISITCHDFHKLFLNLHYQTPSLAEMKNEKDSSFSTNLSVVLPKRNRANTIPAKPTPLISVLWSQLPGGSLTCPMLTAVLCYSVLTYVISGSQKAS